MMYGCLLPSGNRDEFPRLDKELAEREIVYQFVDTRSGGRLYLFDECFVECLPEDEAGHYLGDEMSGHSIYPITDEWLASVKTELLA